MPQRLKPLFNCYRLTAWPKPCPDTNPNSLNLSVWLFSYALSVRLFSWLRCARVLEGIHHGLFESHPFKMRQSEAALQYFEDLNREIFRGGHKLVKFLHRIQILQVIPREHFPFDDAVEIDQIADHARALVHRAADGHFERVIVAVPVRVVAFAIGGEILFGGHLGAVQAVRGGEMIAAGEMGFHEAIVDC